MKTNLEMAIKIFDDRANEFFDSVILPVRFTYATLPPRSINNCVQMGFNGPYGLDGKLKIVAEPMRSKRTLAMFKHKTPYTIYLNSKNLNRSVESIAGSLMHELIHLVDYHINGQFGHPKLRFWNRKKAMRSAPYWYGREFKNYVKKIK